jgi:hypothetical protein
MGHRTGSGIRASNHLPGDEAWLIGEHRSSGEMKEAEAPLEKLAY